MNFSSIKPFDIANGEGVRVSLFTSGCHLHCKGCFNYDAWDFNSGEKFTIETMNYLMDLLKNPNIQGLSILGGEPMSIETQPMLANIIWKVKKELSNKDIWLWTGYTINELLYNEQFNDVYPFTEYILNTVDVIIDGPYIDSLRNLNLQWRGSENQTVHYNKNHKVKYKKL